LFAKVSVPTAAAPPGRIFDPTESVTLPTTVPDPCSDCVPPRTSPLGTAEASSVAVALTSITGEAAIEPVAPSVSVPALTVVLPV